MKFLNTLIQLNEKTKCCYNSWDETQRNSTYNNLILFTKFCSLCLFLWTGTGKLNALRRPDDSDVSLMPLPFSGIILSGEQSICVIPIYYNHVHNSQADYAGLIQGKSGKFPAVGEQRASLRSSQLHFLTFWATEKGRRDLLQIRFHGNDRTISK